MKKHKSPEVSVRRRDAQERKGLYARNKSDRAQGNIQRDSYQKRSEIGRRKKETPRDAWERGTISGNQKLKQKWDGPCRAGNLQGREKLKNNRQTQMNPKKSSGRSSPAIAYQQKPWGFVWVGGVVLFWVFCYSGPSRT